MTKKTKLQYPSELQEDLAFIEHCGYLKKKYPVLRELIHISNEGNRGWISQARFKAIKAHLGEELNGKLIGQSGVHDWMLPVPVKNQIRGVGAKDYHSLYIEMKRQRGYYGTPRAIEKAYTDEQRDWARRMEALGHKCEVAYGEKEASQIVLEYLGKGK